MAEGARSKAATTTDRRASRAGLRQINTMYHGRNPIGATKLTEILPMWRETLAITVILEGLRDGKSPDAAARAEGGRSERRLPARAQRSKHIDDQGRNREE